MNNTVKRDFDAVAATWDEDPRRVSLAHDISTAILREIPVSQNMQALDYGCGSGLLTLALQPFVADISGVDSSRGMLDVLDGKVRKQGLKNVTTGWIDPQQQGQLSACYDLIVSSMTLHHIKDAAEMIARFADALKPGGWLALADLESEDGSFHDDPLGVFHNGFASDFMKNAFLEQGLAEIRVVQAAAIKRKSQDGKPLIYPVILAVGRKLA